MFDSTTIGDIPVANADLVGYYCDGLYAVSEATVRARFPTAILVPISAIGTNAGIVGDVERGDMTEAQGVDWVLMRRAAGLDPTIYCNELNGWGPAKAAFAARGVTEPHWWVADYDGDPTIPPGAIAKQFRGSFRTPPIGTGAHYDQSSVVDHWPGVDGLFGPGGGSLDGGFDMATADQILAAVTMPPPPRPASVAGHTDAELLNIFNTTSNADIITAFKQEGYDYMSALAHPRTVAQVLAAFKPGTVDLAPILAAIADLKAHPGVAADPALAAKVDALTKHLGVGTP